MQLFKLAEELGKTSKELKEELGFDSHLASVPQDTVDRLLGAKNSANAILAQMEAQAEKNIAEQKEEPAQKMAPTETVIVKTRKLEPEPEREVPRCPVDLATVELSIRGCGNKSPYYKYKDLLNGKKDSK